MTGTSILELSQEDDEDEDGDIDQDEDKDDSVLTACLRCVAKTPFRAGDRPGTVAASVRQ